MFATQFIYTIRGKFRFGDAKGSSVLGECVKDYKLMKTNLGMKVIT